MDNYIVSARKYRPATFKSVVGQKSLTTTLKNAIQRNKLAHAYLFCGPRGVGKTSCARIFAKTINCMNLTPDAEACNTCESCLSFDQQRSLSIHELDAASNNSVDDIRSLVDQVRIPPQIGKYKVYIIDEVHMLSTAAFNAFLKTLEEPPRYAIFILATTEKHKILATILSRCQIYDFTRISVADAVEHLQYVAGAENVDADPEALHIIAQKADGGMRDALSIFDQVVSYTGGKITYRAVIENLNILDCEYYFRITDTMLGGQVRDAMLLLNEILEKGFDGQHIITGLAAHFRDLLVCKDESTLILLEAGATIRERYRQTARQCPEHLLYRAIELANRCDLLYRESRNKRLLLELTLIQLCQLTTTPATTPDDKKKTLTPLADTPAAEPPENTTPPVPENTPPLPENTTPAPDTLMRPPKTTALKNLLAGETNLTPNTPPGASHTRAATPFSTEELIRCWDACAATLEKEIHLKNTMINCKPLLLQDSHHIEVTVHNPAQQEELIQHSATILNTLRTQLNNHHIQMHIRIDETSEKQLAYTSAEKYQHLNQINPSLTKLTSEFDLTVD
jgi:DNA polymerase-3 subunit gamma/tau